MISVRTSANYIFENVKEFRLYLLLSFQLQIPFGKSLNFKSNGSLPESLNEKLQIFSKVTYRGQQFGMSLRLKNAFCKTKLYSCFLPRYGRTLPKTWGRQLARLNGMC